MPPLYPPLFVFSLYLDHRALHSFPTRRSSDLSAPRTRTRCRPGRARVPLESRHVLDPRTARARRRADRKSTRLNSSHLGISYAVFCLKKKKSIQETNSSDTRAESHCHNMRLID